MPDLVVDWVSDCSSALFAVYVTDIVVVDWRIAWLRGWLSWWLCGGLVFVVYATDFVTDRLEWRGEVWILLFSDVTLGLITFVADCGWMLTELVTL